LHLNSFSLPQWKKRVGYKTYRKRGGKGMVWEYGMSLSFFFSPATLMFEGQLKRSRDFVSCFVRRTQWIVQLLALEAGRQQGQTASPFPILDVVSDIAPHLLE
jgi:hypothetical protein